MPDEVPEMATSLPLVVSPLRKVLEREGVEIVLVSVEAWPDEVVVRAARSLVVRIDGSETRVELNAGT